MFCFLQRFISVESLLDYDDFQSFTALLGWWINTTTLFLLNVKQWSMIFMIIFCFCCANDDHAWPNYQMSHLLMFKLNWIRFKVDVVLNICLELFLNPWKVSWCYDFPFKIKSCALHPVKTLRPNCLMSWSYYQIQAPKSVISQSFSWILLQTSDNFSS